MELVESGEAVVERNEPLICHCLAVTEADVREAITTLGLTTVACIRRHTGAGDGCAACHGRLRDCLASCATCPQPICSVR